MDRPIKNSSFDIRLPLFIALALCIGVIIGSYFFGGHGTGTISSPGNNKFVKVLKLLESEYVDTVNTEELTEFAINAMLKNLDPHTTYISGQELEVANSELEGGFEGIGVEFQIINDTIVVVSPISGGPSDKVGIISGDKIITVNDEPAAGIQLTINKVFELLRGKKGTKVKIKLLRRNSKEPITVTVVRDKIPTYSLDVSYMENSEVGYMKISRFSGTTYDEFKEALISLQSKGMKKLILDLRDNPGGYLDKAFMMADEFIAGEAMIVYTDGKQDRYDQKYFASGKGLFESGDLIVLVNEGSASASEIVAGALQDNDRALIVGRRTFGKGLVQMPVPLDDGAELRVTISRYYTPSGRSIQKPYVNASEYDNELVTRFEHGEFFTSDSIKFNDSLKYVTASGRTVYGGGGIMPDVFVAQDTSVYSEYLTQLFNKSIIREYTFDYVHDHKKELEKMGLAGYIRSFNISESMLDELQKRAEKAGIKFDENGYAKSSATIKNTLKAFIARGVWKEEGFYPIYNRSDAIYLRALEAIKTNESSALLK